MGAEASRGGRSVDGLASGERGSGDMRCSGAAIYNGKLSVATVGVCKALAEREPVAWRGGASTRAFYFVQSGVRELLSGFEAPPRTAKRVDNLLAWGVATENGCVGLV